MSTLFSNLCLTLFQSFFHFSCVELKIIIKYFQIFDNPEVLKQRPKQDSIFGNFILLTICYPFFTFKSVVQCEFTGVSTNFEMSNMNFFNYL